LTPFLDGPPDMRQVIYTTHAIEPVNMGLRKLTTNQGSFPSDEALTKLAYLALCNISQKWRRADCADRPTVRYAVRLWA